LLRTVTPIVKSFLPSTLGTSVIFTIPVIPYVQEKPAPLTIADLISGVISAVVVYFYVTTKHWLLNNLLGLSFSIQCVALFGLGSYKIGCILLSGLFFLRYLLGVRYRCNGDCS
jgi:minor histocompatibility antigen H13